LEKFERFLIFASFRRYCSVWCLSFCIITFGFEREIRLLRTVDFESIKFTMIPNNDSHSKRGSRSVPDTNEVFEME